MDKSAVGAPRQMDQKKIIKRHLTKISRESYWLGFAVGAVLGIIFGVVIGFGLGSPTTVVIPLSQGVKV